MPTCLKSSWLKFYKVLSHHTNIVNIVCLHHSRLEKKNGSQSPGITSMRPPASRIALSFWRPPLKAGQGPPMIRCWVLSKPKTSKKPWTLAELWWILCEHFNITQNLFNIANCSVLFCSTWNPVMLHWALTQGHGVETLWQWRAQDVPGWIISYEPLAL